MASSQTAVDTSFSGSTSIHSATSSNSNPSVSDANTSVTSWFSRFFFQYRVCDTSAIELEPTSDSSRKYSDMEGIRTLPTKSPKRRNLDHEEEKNKRRQRKKDRQDEELLKEQGRKQEMIAEKGSRMNIHSNSSRMEGSDGQEKRKQKTDRINNIEDLVEVKLSEDTFHAPVVREGRVQVSSCAGGVTVESLRKDRVTTLPMQSTSTPMSSHYTSTVDVADNISKNSLTGQRQMEIVSSSDILTAYPKTKLDIQQNNSLASVAPVLSQSDKQESKSAAELVAEHYSTNTITSSAILSSDIKSKIDSTVVVKHDEPYDQEEEKITKQRLLKAKLKKKLQDEVSENKLKSPLSASSITSTSTVTSSVTDISQPLSDPLLTVPRNSTPSKSSTTKSVTTTDYELDDEDYDVELQGSDHGLLTGSTSTATSKSTHQRTRMSAQIYGKLDSTSRNTPQQKQWKHTDDTNEYEDGEFPADQQRGSGDRLTSTNIRGSTQSDRTDVSHSSKTRRSPDEISDTSNTRASVSRKGKMEDRSSTSKEVKKSMASRRRRALEEAAEDLKGESMKRSHDVTGGL